VRNEGACEWTWPKYHACKVRWQGFERDEIAAQGGIPPVALGVLTGTAVFGVASMYLSRHEHDDRGIPIPSPDVQGGTRVALILGTMFLRSFPAFLAVKRFEPLLPPNPNDV